MTGNQLFYLQIGLVTEFKPYQDSGQELPESASTQLPEVFRQSWERVKDLLASRPTDELIASLSPKEDLAAERKWNGSIVRKVQSSNGENSARYSVEIIQQTGESKCTCLNFSHNKDPACKHIVAVASQTGCLTQFIAWLKLEKNVRPFGSFLLRPAGGKKPGQRQRSTAGSGYTRREEVETAPMSLRELGYCFLGAGHAKGRISFLEPMCYFSETSFFQVVSGRIALIRFSSRSSPRFTPTLSAQGAVSCSRTSLLRLISYCLIVNKTIKNGPRESQPFRETVSIIWITTASEFVIHCSIQQ